MKICSIVGARPQFIKAAPLSRELRKRFQEILIHTGQHYDANLSRVFFQEMDIPEPDYSLEIGSFSHGKQTSLMMLGIPCVTLRNETEWVETVKEGWNVLVGTDREAIIEAVQTLDPPPERKALFGDGHAAEKISRIIEKWSRSTL